MLAEIDWGELQEWALLESIEPWSQTRGDLRMAQLLALTANCHRDGKKRPTAYTVDDFLPHYGAPIEDAEDGRAERMEQVALQLTQAAGAFGWTGDLSAVPDEFLSEEDLAARRAAAARPPQAT